MDFTRLDGHQIGESADVTTLHPSQIERDYAVRIDGYEDGPMAACVSPAYLDSPGARPIPETYAEIEANPSILVKYAEPGRAVFLLPAAGPQRDDCTRLSLRQVHGYMVPLSLLRCA